MLPEGLASIGRYAFARCESLTGVTIPENVTWIDEYAFSHCSSFTEIILPEGITEIAAGTFAHCRNMLHIVIPESVDTIERFAFYECFHLNIFCHANKNQGRIWNEGWDIYESEGALSGRVEYEYLPVYWKGEWQYNSNGIPEPLI